MVQVLPLIHQILTIDVEEEIYLIDWLITSMSTSYAWKATWNEALEEKNISLKACDVKSSIK
jgi:hypothetical protein